MTLADTAHGSDWILWGVFAVFVILTIALLSGHGSKFISGYNTASKEEKARYDEKKLCRVYGIGMGVIAILLLITGLFDIQFCLCAISFNCHRCCNYYYPE